MAVIDRKLINITDATVWARAFVESYCDAEPTDETVMCAWFANAIESGRVAGYATALSEKGV